MIEQAYGQGKDESKPECGEDILKLKVLREIWDIVPEIFVSFPLFPGHPHKWKINKYIKLVSLTGEHLTSQCKKENLDVRYQKPVFSHASAYSC